MMLACLDWRGCPLLHYPVILSRACLMAVPNSNAFSFGSFRQDDSQSVIRTNAQYAQDLTHRQNVLVQATVGKGR
jgi:hypothetical protein